MGIPDEKLHAVNFRSSTEMHARDAEVMQNFEQYPKESRK